jgi:lipopolysaccharide/colanic/teichoic acid biosynthesis glycosyltransferase
VKRGLDVLLSAAGLVLLKPALLLGLALAGPARARVADPLPAVPARPARAPVHALQVPQSCSTIRPASRTDEERLPRVGSMLRRTSLDELPELWNVLARRHEPGGSPVPLLMEYLPLYTPEQARRHDVRPGLTGWAQVNGRNAISWEEKFRLDLWYVEHRKPVAGPSASSA